MNVRVVVWVFFREIGLFWLPQLFARKTLRPPTVFLQVPKEPWKLTDDSKSDDKSTLKKLHHFPAAVHSPAIRFFLQYYQSTALSAHITRGEFEGLLPSDCGAIFGAVSGREATKSPARGIAKTSGFFLYQGFLPFFLTRFSVPGFSSLQVFLGVFS